MRTAMRFDLRFDWRVMGTAAYVPLIVAVVMTLFDPLMRGSLRQLIPALEFIWPLFAAWWSIFLFQDVMEEPGGETIFSYPVSRFSLGIARVAVFFLGYVMLTAWVVGVIDFSLSLFVQLLAECYFYAGLGFFAMTLLRHTGWSLSVAFCYAGMQILTGGKLVPLLNVYLFNLEVLPFGIVLKLSLKSFIMGTVLWGMGQWSFQKSEAYH